MPLVMEAPWIACDLFLDEVWRERHCILKRGTTVYQVRGVWVVATKPRPPTH